MIYDDLLSRAKKSMQLSALMILLGFGDRAKKSARCMFHEDKSASFSMYVRDDGEERWKCHAGCGQGDAIDFLAKHRGLSNADACREFIRIAGVTPPSLPPVVLTDSPPAPFTPPTFDWQSCVAAFNAEHRAKLVELRGYMPKFVSWLHGQGLIGLFDGDHIAFPVNDAAGNVVGCHYRLPEDGSWRYHPTGTHTAPFIIGDPARAKNVMLFESQWDMLAALGCLHHHIQPLTDTGAIATRGAGNARLLAGLCSPDAVVYAFGQNDPAGQKWLTTVAATCGCKSVQLITPSPHKDMNDWTRAGATAEDVRAAMASAQPILVPAGPDLHTAPPKSVSKPVVSLVEEPEAPDSAPFPIECLPAEVACMVRAVARAHRVPESMPGLMALALVAASLGKRLGLDWRPGKPLTPANLFIVLTAGSGAGKTETAKQLATVFLNFERAMQENWRKNTLPKLQADLRFHETQLKRLDRKLIKESTSAADSDRFRGEQVLHQAQVEKLKGLLFEPKLSVADATVERVATVLQQNDETIFSMSSDARKLCDNLLGRYSANKKLADDGIYLCAFSGDCVTVDRQGREGVRLVNPCMTLLWAIQPDALEMLLDEDSLQQGGFLARCLLAHTHAEPQHIGGDTCTIPDDSRACWENLIRNLILTYRQPSILPATETETDLLKNYAITATPEACKRLETFFNEIVDRRKTGELADVSQYASRWAEHAARIAITLHAGLHGPTAHLHSLVLETTENAVTLAKWFADQQLGLLAKGRIAAATRVDDEVFKLLESNREYKAQDFISGREVLRARITVTQDAAMVLLARMEANGLLVGENTTPAHGGRTTRIFRRVQNPAPE